MAWVVCPYSDHDYDRVVALHDAVYPTYRAQPDVWHAAAQFDELRGQPHRLIARDTATQQLIGYGALHSARAQQARLDLMIHPAWQRQGVGQGLLDQLIDQARIRGNVGVHVRARLDYPHALRFLVHRGFIETHRMYGLRLAVQHADMTPFWPRVQYQSHQRRWRGPTCRAHMRSKSKRGRRCTQPRMRTHVRCGVVAQAHPNRSG